MNSTTALRNRIYRDMDSERRAIGMIPMTDLCADRLAYAETSDATHRDGERYVWRDDPPRAAHASIPQRHPEGEPATAKETKEIIWTLVGFCLVGLGLAYLVWAGSHGGSPWTR
jgi:hypothetical protein